MNKKILALALLAGGGVFLLTSKKQQGIPAATNAATATGNLTVLPTNETNAPVKAEFIPGSTATYKGKTVTIISVAGNLAIVRLGLSQRVTVQLTDLS